jgi:hypothetical protein
MIVFRGWGWTVFFLGIGCFVAGLVGVYTLEPAAAAHTGAQSTTDGWRAVALGLALEAPIIWVIAFNRERGGPGRDHFCYIPLTYWPRFWPRSRSPHSSRRSSAPICLDGEQRRRIGDRYSCRRQWNAHRPISVYSCSYLKLTRNLAR